MIHLRRVAALLMGVLLLLAPASGAWGACLSHAHAHAAHGRHAGEHARHCAASMVAGGSVRQAPHISTISGAPTTHTGQRAIPGGCAAMASCAPVAVSAGASEIAIAAGPGASLPASRTLIPPTRTTAPDLPPPRA